MCISFVFEYCLEYHTYGSPISRDLARFDSSLRDLISRDFGCKICEITKWSKLNILVENFGTFNQKLLVKMEIILLWFFISPKILLIWKDFNVYKISKMFSTFKCTNFQLFMLEIQSREISQSREILLDESRISRDSKNARFGQP